MASVRERVLRYFSALVYRPDAGCVLGMIPFTGVYWDDEIPDHEAIEALGEEARWQVYRLFCLRRLLWRRVKLNAEQREFWESVKSQVPECPVFQRMRPSIEVLRADVCVNREFDAFEAAMDAELEAEEKKANKPDTGPS
jgi:hypothetical protein